MDLRLSTPRLLLRPLQPADAGVMFRYRSRPDVWRYQLWRPEEEAEVRAFIERQAGAAPDTPGAWFGLAITRRSDGKMIGDVGLHFPEGESDAAEIGITLSPAFQKRGYAAEALQEVFRFLFLSLGKERIDAGADPRNLPSVRLLERAGMRRVAYVRRRMVVRGETVDDVTYSIRKREFPGTGRAAG